MLYVLTFGSYLWAREARGVTTPPPTSVPPFAPRLVERVALKEHSYRTLREALRAAESVKKMAHSYDSFGRSRKPLPVDVGIWLVKSTRNTNKARLIATYSQWRGLEALMPEASRCDEHDDCKRAPDLAHACFLATSEALALATENS